MKIHLDINLKRDINLNTSRHETMFQFFFFFDICVIHAVGLVRGLRSFVIFRSFSFGFFRFSHLVTHAISVCYDHTTLSLLFTEL